MDTKDTQAVFDAMAAAFKEGGEEAFESLRSEILEEHFRTEVPPEKQQKARQIQWRIDGIRNKVKDPTERYNRLVAEMWKSFGEGAEALKQLQAELIRLQFIADGKAVDDPLVNEIDISPVSHPLDAKIIPFKTKT